MPQRRLGVAESGDGESYRRFWAAVGETFPDLGGAASTRRYLEDERRLLGEHLPPLASLRLLKTDLWDEAKNTRILCWAQREGAVAVGIDISESTVRLAQSQGRGLGVAVADVRRVPFRDSSFDAVYSMGTIEHFQDPQTALGEIARVLRPGGRALVGVPNRWDPFLRPALVTLLRALGLYAYGYERSFSRRALRRMVEAAGLRPVADTGILFLPGWLRILDLVAHCYWPPLERVTRPALRPFAWLDRHLRGLRRHGYLIVSVAEKPRA